MTATETQIQSIKALEVEYDMAAREYHLEDDGTLDTIIGCNSCEWVGRYNSDVGDGLNDSPEAGPVAYSDKELNLMRITNAYGMASEDHFH